MDAFRGKLPQGIQCVPVYDVTVEPFGNFMLGCGVIVHNSGKSFAAKREMTNAFLITDDDIIICDPEAEVRHEVA